MDSVNSEKAVLEAQCIQKDKVIKDLTESHRNLEQAIQNAQVQVQLIFVVFITSNCRRLSRKTSFCNKKSKNF